MRAVTCPSRGTSPDRPQKIEPTSPWMPYPTRCSFSLARTATPLSRSPPNTYSANPTLYPPRIAHTANSSLSAKTTLWKNRTKPRLSWPDTHTNRHSNPTHSWGWTSSPRVASTRWGLGKATSAVTLPRTMTSPPPAPVVKAPPRRSSTPSSTVPLRSPPGPVTFRGSLTLAMTPPFGLRPPSWAPLPASSRLRPQPFPRACFRARHPRCLFLLFLPARLM